MLHGRHPPQQLRGIRENPPSCSLPFEIITSSGSSASLRDGLAGAGGGGVEGGDGRIGRYSMMGGEIGRAHV